MNRIETRALVEGAIFAAVTVLIGIVRFYIPVIALVSIVWSVPTILIAFRHGFKVSINSVIVSSLLVAILTQPIEGLSFFIGFGLPGIIMGYLLKMKLGPGKTIFITSIVFTVCSVTSMYLGMLVIGMDIAKTYEDMFTEMKNTYREMSNSIANMMGTSSEEFLKQAEVFEKSIDLLKLILPVSFWASGLMLSFINFKLTRIVLKRINYFLEDVKAFSLWRLSNKWVIFFMSMLLYVIVELYLIKLPQLYTFTMNTYTAITISFTVLGLSVAKFFLDKYNVSKALKVIIIFLLLFTFGNITMLAGVLDIFLDFRKLQKQPDEVR